MKPKIKIAVFSENPQWFDYILGSSPQKGLFKLITNVDDIRGYNFDTIKREQDEKAALLKQQALEKAQQEEQQQSENFQNEVANIQMTSELQQSLNTKPANIMERWVFDETTIDMSLLPADFHTFDKAKIKEAIKNGCREIPGVVIRKELSNVSR
jgi:hypothetical protein